MSRIQPSSWRCCVQESAALRSGGALLLLELALAAQGCSFDTAPTMLARDDGGSAAKWQPPSLARRNRIIGQQMQDAGSDGQAKAERAISIITSVDAGIRGRDADGGKMMDAGKPPQQPPQRDAGGSRPSGGDNSDAAASTGTRAAQDGSVPGMTKPDTMKQCMPGMYEGTFEGPVTFAVGSINSVSGSMRAELVLEPSGDALQIRDGMMKGMDNTGIGMTSGWTGRLNCATKQLENGRHESGAWQNGSTFTGTLEGSYTVDPSSISGTWKVQSEQIPLAGGNGTWHVTLRDNPTP